MDFGPWARWGAVAVGAPFFAVMLAQRRCRWRLRGDVNHLTVTRRLLKFDWRRRDFAWSEIERFSTDSTGEYVDVVIENHQGVHPLNLKMTTQEAEELVEALTKAQVEAKMEAISRSGYRGVRVEAERVEAEIDSNIDTVASAEDASKPSQS